MVEGFNHFQVLHHFVLAKLATSSIRLELRRPDRDHVQNFSVFLFCEISSAAIHTVAIHKFGNACHFLDRETMSRNTCVCQVDG